jgi:hypothetical protein
MKDFLQLLFTSADFEDKCLAALIHNYHQFHEILNEE